MKLLEILMLISHVRELGEMDPLLPFDISLVQPARLGLFVVPNSDNVGDGDALISLARWCTHRGDSIEVFSQVL